MMCDPQNQPLQFLVRYVLGEGGRGGKDHSSLQVVKLVFGYVNAKISPLFCICVSFLPLFK